MFAFLSKYKNMDMLNGSLWDKILVFAIPLALTSVLQELYNAADVAVLGNFIGSDAIAAVGTNIPIIGLVVNLFVGVALGANVVVARYLGMKDLENASNAVHTAFFLALLVGFLISLIGVPLADSITQMLGVPENVAERSTTYLRVYLLGMPFLALYNFEAALFRSRGDTNSPLIALVIASIFNIIGNIVVVKYLNMDTGGVALTTVLANGVSSLFLFCKMRSSTDFLHIDYKKILKPQSTKARAIIKIGLPAGIQGMVFSLSNLLIQSAINSLGTDAMAASAAGFTIEINVYCLINAFGLAATTFISQNYGAKNLTRCKDVIKVCFWLDMALTTIFGGFVLIYCRELLGLLADTDAVIAIGVIRIFAVVGPDYLNVAMEIMSGTMRGFGYSLGPAIMTVIGICSFRVFWVYTAFASDPTYTTLMMCYGLSWTFTTILLFIIFVIHQRKIFKSYKS